LREILKVDMQKILLAIVFAALCSCVGTISSDKRLTVVIEPQRFFVEALVDTLFEVESLVPSGLSPETYDPTPDRMLRLARSRACFYVGSLGFETTWIDRLKANNPEVKFYRTDLNISKIQTSHDCSDPSHADHQHADGDPHVWTSPRNALTMVENICAALTEISPENSEVFLENKDRAMALIRQTDAEIAALLENSTQRAFIIFHPSLTYFARDYGLHQMAIEADGKEPSPEQLAKLIEAARAEGVRTVFVQQEFDAKNAEIIARETGCRLVRINPLSYDWRGELLKIAKILAE